MLRSKLNLTQSGLAEAVNYSQGYIGDIEIGRSKPSSKFIKSLITIFSNVNGDWLLTGEGEMLKSALPQTDPAARDLPETLPWRGMAKCSVTGWYNAVDYDEAVERPLWVDDPDAFFVSAAGQSMIPEGINSGDTCLVSPGREAKVGDIVYIRDLSDKLALKRWIGSNDDEIILRGWQDRNEGRQRSFEDARKKHFLKELYPVLEIYPMKPAGGQADMRTDLPELPPDRHAGSGATFQADPLMRHDATSLATINNMLIVELQKKMTKMDRAFDADALAYVEKEAERIHSLGLVGSGLMGAIQYACARYAI